MEQLKKGLIFIGKCLYYGFFGISLKYYITNFFWGILPFLFMFYMGMNNTSAGFNWGTFVGIVVVMLLYPYARLGYALITDTLLGDRVWILPLGTIFIWYFIRMVIVWMASPVLIPVGLIYLAYHQFKMEKEIISSMEIVE